MSSIDRDRIAARAVVTAGQWQARANELLTSEEKGIQEQMRRLLTHPMDKVVLTRLIDQSFRSQNAGRVADQVNYLLSEYGVPDFFSRVEKLLVQMFRGFGRHFPALSVPRMVERMRKDSSRAIIPGEPEFLHAHLQKRKQQGVRMNINHLGEAVLGEEESLARLDTYIADMENPEIEYISVKISTIFSQISSLAFEETVTTLVERLSRLYRVAKANMFVRPDGTRVPKFVNLDMEEYRDLDITYAAFTRTLDREEFKDYSAGIVLQAYLPDSHPIQEELTEWARRRVAAGGSPVKLRIVKGANMEMEQVESALHNWPLAPYDHKLAVDANYKRMLEYGMQPENIKAVNLGVASHNLFELAYAFELGRELGVTDHFYFEMLEGMADHVRRAIFESTGDVLLYAPVATRDQFINAIAYLVRRLDENTGAENFLRYAPDLAPDSEAWALLKNRFLESVIYMDKARAAPSRTQDRNRETFPERTGPFYENEFTNEPDTDWSLAANREWARSIRDKWMKAPGDSALEIPVVVEGEERFAGRKIRECFDPNQWSDDPARKVKVAVHALAGEADIMDAVAAAKTDPDGWRSLDRTARGRILARAAMEIRRARGDLIGAACANTGKVFTETDPEVSEAADFAEFYPLSARRFAELPNIRTRGKGVGLVISPWNFPVAIPCGGIMAALAAGNTVIFKPASAAVVTAWRLCQAIWQAGVGKSTLQFVPFSGAELGTALTNHPDVDFIILTGGTDTGLEILKKRPGVYLAAETGGKNATIVTAMSDRDQAIKDVLHSAFSNCGQKCSATSLLILEKEIYEDERFKRQLVDAARSYPLGPAWEFEHKMGPLVIPPAGDLKRGLTSLEPGESWALEPEPVPGNPYLWRPGIKYGVKPGSYTYQTEFFGPVLGVMCAADLDEAIQMVNGTGYGLTSGLESLDLREQDKWQAGIKAGNLYINRGTTGAVVLRQPFGGMGKSALGAGIKAGGPNYVSQFMEFEETDFPRLDAISKDHPLLNLAREWEVKLRWGKFPDLQAPDVKKAVRAIKSYLWNMETEFGREKDYFHLRGQDNRMRYLPVGRVVVRVHPMDTLFEILARIAAARISGCGLLVALPSGADPEVAGFLAGKEGRRLVGDVPVSELDDAGLIRLLPRVERIRYAAGDRVPKAVFREAAKTGFYIARAPVLMEGRIELLHYFQEQAVCNNYHRYGNLGERGGI